MNVHLAILNDNWRLPKFSHITLADSRYVECLQITDLIVVLIRETKLDSNPKYSGVNLDFVNLKDVSNIEL